MNAASFCGGRRLHSETPLVSGRISHGKRQIFLSFAISAPPAKRRHAPDEDKYRGLYTEGNNSIAGISLWSNAAGGSLPEPMPLSLCRVPSLPLLCLNVMSLLFDLLLLAQSRGLCYANE